MTIRRDTVYIVTTSGVALLSLITGLGNLVPFPHIASDLAHLGYPPYFRIILGTWKIIAAIVIAIPMKGWIKDLAYMGILLDLSGAAASRLAVGDGAIKIFIPLILSAWVVVSWFGFRTRLVRALHH